MSLLGVITSVRLQYSSVPAISPGVGIGYIGSLCAHTWRAATELQGSIPAAVGWLLCVTKADEVWYMLFVVPPIF